MGFFDLFKRTDINEGIATWKNTPGAVLLDVRSAEEYRAGHIPGSVNVPVKMIQKVTGRIPDKATPVFSYCLSGARSGNAVSAMKRMGYQNVTNIGGINGYRGDIEK